MGCKCQSVILLEEKAFGIEGKWVANGLVATLAQVGLGEEEDKTVLSKMASNDDSPTSLHGQPWSVWADRLGRDSPLSE